MKRTALAAIGLAVLLVTAGLATAAPGATTTPAPADGPNEHANDAAQDGDDNADHADENATDDHEDADEPEMTEAAESEQSDCTCSDDANETETDENESAVDENATQAREENEARQGPPTEMPANVPDHVSEIHMLIQDYLNGDLSGSLGSAISDVVGQTPDAGNQPADAGDDEADEHGPEMTPTTESSA